VSRSFTVNAVVPGAPTIGTAIAGDTQASVDFVAPVNIGGSAITSYTVTVNPADVAPVSGASSPIVVTGLTNGQPYTFTVTADNVAGTGSASGASNSITPAATQTITFNNPGAQNFGTTPTFTATSDSGLNPTFTSSTTGVCTITSLGVVTFLTAGTCIVNADQPGNGSYLAATQVTRSFTVNAVLPGAPTIGTATAGNAQATITFTAPASNGGVAITGYTVTANPGGITRAATASPYTFTGLTNGTSYTFTVAATNSVGTGGASAVSNAVTPSLPLNSAPVISQGSSVSVTMSEDGAPTPFALSLNATDPDGDSLTWSISGAPQHGSASVSAGSVSYTPTANYNGSDSFVVQVSDGDDTASITVNVTITPVNDAPVISGTPTTSLEQDVAYSFTPTATDVDTADVLTFSITNKPTWASFNTATGALTGTPTHADAGVSGAIVISVSDGTANASLPAFDLEVISTIDPLQPVVTPPATLELDATGLFTPVTVRQLLGLSPSATQADIDLILKGLASDGVSGKECCTTSLQGLIGSDRLLLAPGRHEVTWKAVNSAGIAGEAKQIVNIRPLVSLSKSQIAVRDSDVEFRVLLNGPSPTYPLTIPYVIDASTTATTAEHNLVSGTATFTQAGQVEVAVPVKLNAVTGFSDSQLVVVLGSGINAGVANRHVIDIRQGNVPPIVNLIITQGGINTSIVTPNGGPVTVAATVTDANKTDTHSFSWIGSILGGDATSASRTIDPSSLRGSHQVQVVVTDSGGAVVQASAYFRVVSSLPVLDANTDTDQDGISDELEGTSDSDDNGIPDYLDNMPSPNILPQQGSTTNAYLIECDPGVRCGLGLFARGGNSGGVQILDDEVGSSNGLIVDPAFEPVGGIFDFAIRDLPTPGQSVRVVIPQRSAIPANAVYRKFQDGRWVTFVSNTNNALHSAVGNPGYCPPPGTAEWTSGLTAGHLCVQLTIEDGGPNDDDGLVNSAVVDPGAVSEAKAVEPPEPKPPVDFKTKGSGGSIEGLIIVFLGGLLMLRYASKPVVVIALALVASATQADTLEKTFIRVDVYQVEGNVDAGDFNQRMARNGFDYRVTKYDVERTGYQVALGYQFTDVAYVELGYLDLGNVSVNLSVGGDENQPAFGEAMARYYPRTADGGTLVFGARLPLTEHWYLSPEVGIFVWQGDIEVNGAQFALDYDNNTDLLVGLRLDYQFSKHFGLGAGVKAIRFNDQQVELWGLSGRFSF
jgi:VCBS repeat-containing protein